MKAKKTFFSIINYIHVVFWLSLCTFGVIYLTLGIMIFPALTSAFSIGKEVLFGEYDTTDSVLKRFFGGIKKHIGTMRYFPMYLFFVLECAGLYAAGLTGMDILAYVCNALMGLVLTLCIFACLCAVHFEKKPDIVTVGVVMIWSLPAMLAIWLIMTLCCLFFGEIFIVISLPAGGLLLGIMQAAALYGILSFKSKTGSLTESEEKFLSGSKGDKS